MAQTVQCAACGRQVMPNELQGEGCTKCGIRCIGEPIVFTYGSFEGLTHKGFEIRTMRLPQGRTLAITAIGGDVETAVEFCRGGKVHYYQSYEAWLEDATNPVILDILVSCTVIRAAKYKASL